MRLRNELVQAVERSIPVEDGLTRRFTYGLYRDTTPAQRAFFYLKCCMEVWHGQQLLREEMDVAGGLGSDVLFARSVFHRISEAPEPVFPDHLGDVVRDQVILRKQCWPVPASLALQG